MLIGIELCQSEKGLSAFGWFKTQYGFVIVVKHHDNKSPILNQSWIFRNEGQRDAYQQTNGAGPLENYGDKFFDYKYQLVKNRENTPIKVLTQ